MKECWINVYEYTLSKEKWLGIKYSDEIVALEAALNSARKNNPAKYRLHVKLKDKPGLVYSYKYTFDDMPPWVKYPHNSVRGVWV